mgnify:CR=1 FL=1
MAKINDPSMVAGAAFGRAMFGPDGKRAVNGEALAKESVLACAGILLDSARSLAKHSGHAESDVRADLKARLLAMLDGWESHKKDN